MLIALAILVLAQEVVPTAPSEAPPPPRPVEAAPAPPPIASVPLGDLSTAPPLPEGALLPVARSDKGETFLVVDRAARGGDMADFWTFEAFSPPVEVSPGVLAVQGLAHHDVDCVSKTDRTVASAGYDEAGDPVVALAASAPAPLTSDSAYALIADAVCRGAAFPTSGQITGHAAALAEARQPPAAASPQ